MILHASAVQFLGKGVLFLGDSSNGKSDLCLRLIEQGAHLIADDVVSLRVENGKVLLSPLDKNKGLLEVRGLGIYALPFKENIPLCHVFCLEEKYERLPTPEVYEIEGFLFPKIKLNPFEQSVLVKIKYALEKKPLPFDALL